MKGSLGHQPLSPAPQGRAYIEGDSQREEAGVEVAEDAFKVVQVAPFAAAVRVGPDEGTAVRDIQATHITTLQEGGRDTSELSIPRVAAPGPPSSCRLPPSAWPLSPHTLQMPTAHFNFLK